MKKNNTALCILGTNHYAEQRLDKGCETANRMPGTHENHELVTVGKTKLCISWLHASN